MADHAWQDCEPVVEVLNRRGPRAPSNPWERCSGKAGSEAEGPCGESQQTHHSKASTRGAAPALRGAGMPVSETRLSRGAAKSRLSRCDPPAHSPLAPYPQLSGKEIVSVPDVIRAV